MYGKAQRIIILYNTHSERRTASKKNDKCFFSDLRSPHRVGLDSGFLSHSWTAGRMWLVYLFTSFCIKFLLCFIVFMHVIIKYFILLRNRFKTNKNVDEWLEINQNKYRNLVNKPFASPRVQRSLENPEDFASLYT
jgi:hypothetical protein